jgi:hypothetical protein
MKRIEGKALASSISAGIADTIEKIVTTCKNRPLCQAREQRVESREQTARPLSDQRTPRYHEPAGAAD